MTDNDRSCSVVIAKRSYRVHVRRAIESSGKKQSDVRQMYVALATKICSILLLVTSSCHMVDGGMTA